jgi:hypothetical protein
MMARNGGMSTNVQKSKTKEIRKVHLKELVVYLKHNAKGTDVLS